MAYREARAGIALAGVTYAGLLRRSYAVIIGDQDCSSLGHVLDDGLKVTLYADGQRGTFAFSLRGLTPQIGQPVKLREYRPHSYIFSGVIVQIETDPIREVCRTPDGDPEAIWHCLAVDDRWLLDHRAAIFETFHGVAVNAAVARVLKGYTHTDYGFRVGYVPEDLGTIDMEIDFEAPSQVFDRIARAKAAQWELTPWRAVNIWQVPAEAPHPTVTQHTIKVWGAKYGIDDTQRRTYGIGECKGSRALSAVSPVPGTSLPVEDTTPFAWTGGFIRTGRSILTYSGKTAGSGNGSLLNLQSAGSWYDIHEGDEVSPLVIKTDAGAASDLASRVGAGDGVAVIYAQDPQFTESEMAGLLEQEIATYGYPAQSIQFTTLAQAAKPGRALTVDINTDHHAITGTFRIDTVEITPWRGIERGLARTVTASVYRPPLTALLKRLARG